MVNEPFLTWVQERINALEKELDQLKGVLELNKEYVATRTQKTEMVLFDKETPTECIRSLFTSNPDFVFDTDDLQEEIDRLRTSGMLETNAAPEKSSRSLVHSSMNWLVKQGFVTKLPPDRKKGPARYKKVK